MPGKAPEGKADCAASIGGILLAITPSPTFRKAQRGREEKTLMKSPKPPPPIRRDMCLMIASNMTCLPGPWNHWPFRICKLLGPQLIWRWPSFIFIPRSYPRFSAARLASRPRPEIRPFKVCSRAFRLIQPLMAAMAPSIIMLATTRSWNSSSAI
jgi:hypothetical protein